MTTENKGLVDGPVEPMFSQCKSCGAAVHGKGKTECPRCARIRELEAEVEKRTKEASAADAGFDEAIRQERVWRVEAEVRCRKLEEALRGAGKVLRNARLFAQHMRGHGINNCQQIIDQIDHALLDQADGEEG